ncbi:MAG: hypothetical protein QM765_19200 [Myxococcales bacterium]
MSVAAAYLAALVLLAAAPDAGDASASAPPKLAYEQALSTARAAAEAGEADRTLAAYELAWRRSIEAWQASAFGTRTLTIPIGDLRRGDFRTSKVEIPAGDDVQDHVAEEAALAAARLGRREQAVSWALRIQARVDLRSTDLTSGQRDALEKLRLWAVAASRPEDAVYYDRLLNKDEADRRARWESEAAERQRFQRIAGAVTAAVLALAGYFLVKLARAVAAARRELGPQGQLDFVAFSGVRVLGRDPDGRPFRWRSSGLDLFGRVALSAVLWSTVPLALFGAVAFWRLGWDHARPDKLGETVLIMGLADLFAAFACFMALMQLGSPPSAIRRHVELRAEGLAVRTVRGLVLTKVFDELVPYSAIVDLRVLEHVEHHREVTVRLHLAIAELPGRRLVLGGSGKPEKARGSSKPWRRPRGCGWPADLRMTSGARGPTLPALPQTTGVSRAIGPWHRTVHRRRIHEETRQGRGRGRGRPGRRGAARRVSRRQRLRTRIDLDGLSLLLGCAPVLHREEADESIRPAHSLPLCARSQRLQAVAAGALRPCFPARRGEGHGGRRRAQAHRRAELPVTAAPTTRQQPPRRRTRSPSARTRRPGPPSRPSAPRSTRRRRAHRSPSWPRCPRPGRARRSASRATSPRCAFTGAPGSRCRATTRTAGPSGW